MIKTTNVLSAITLLTLVVATGCAAPTSEAQEPDEETLGQTAGALTNVDACAMGTTANAVGDIRSLHDTESYSRANGYIDGICPSMGKDRVVTIVDFQVAAINGSVNRFDVRPTWWTATNKADCEKLELNVRLQKLRKGTTSTFDPVGNLESIHGEWVTDFFEPPHMGHCRAPYWYKKPMNMESYYEWDTTKYRVRAFGIQFDGVHHPTIEIEGHSVSF